MTFWRKHGIGSDFLDMTPKVQATKGKYRYTGFYQNLKFLCFEG